jgi:signal transduction histidine kinase
MTFIHRTIRSRYGEKQIRLVLTLVQLAEEITEEMQLLQTENSKYNLHITVLKKPINLDQNLIKNSIINLITNAIKYSETCCIDFTTEINDTHCIIKVKDEGIGIPKKISNIYLSPFQGT